MKYIAVVRYDLVVYGVGKTKATARKAGNAWADKKGMPRHMLVIIRKQPWDNPVVGRKLGYQNGWE